jgi:hypothetical protein
MPCCPCHLLADYLHEVARDANTGVGGVKVTSIDTRRGAAQQSQFYAGSSLSLCRDTADAELKINAEM